MPLIGANCPKIDVAQADPRAAHRVLPDGSDRAADTVADSEKSGLKNPCAADSRAGSAGSSLAPTPLEADPLHWPGKE